MSTVKYRGWKWWLRFKKPHWTWEDSGCISDSHAMDGPYGGCPCNYNYTTRCSVEGKGFKRVGTTFPLAYYIKNYFYNEKENLLVINYHICGR